MVGYKFYWHDPVKGYELLGVLPERRKDPARITEKSVSEWKDKVFGNKLSTKDVCFVMVEINENRASSRSTAGLLGEVQKESTGIDEFWGRTIQSFQADHVKCISCGRERFEHEMQKIFYKKGKGICRFCFKSEPEE